MDIKSERIWNLLTRVRSHLPKNTACPRYKLSLYSPNSAHPPIEMFLLDFTDETIQKILEDYKRLWDKYTACDVEVSGVVSNGDNTYNVTFSSFAELIPHKEFTVNTMNIFNLKHDSKVFRFKKPLCLVIRKDDGELLDIDVKSWRDVLRNIILYAYKNRREAFKLLWKDKDGAIGRKLKTTIDEKDKSNYMKVGNKYIYINYNVQRLIEVCAEIVTFSGLRLNDFGIKTDFTKDKKPKKTGTNPHK